MTPRELGHPESWVGSGASGTLSGAYMGCLCLMAGESAQWTPTTNTWIFISLFLNHSKNCYSNSFTCRLTKIFQVSIMVLFLAFRRTLSLSHSLICQQPSCLSYISNFIVVRCTSHPLLSQRKKIIIIRRLVGIL